MSLGVSFETCLRRRGDVIMGHRCYVFLRRRYDVPGKCRRDVPLRCLGGAPQRRRWLFRLRRTCDIAGTYREMSLRCRYEVLLLVGSKFRQCDWLKKHNDFNTDKRKNAVNSFEKDFLS